MAAAIGVKPAVAFKINEEMSQTEVRDFLHRSTLIEFMLTEDVAMRAPESCPGVLGCCTRMNCASFHVIQTQDH